MNHLLNRSWPVLRLCADGSLAVVCTNDNSAQMQLTLELTLNTLGYATERSTIGEMLDEGRALGAFSFAPLGSKHCGVLRCFFTGKCSDKPRAESEDEEMMEVVANALAQEDKEDFWQKLLSKLNGTDGFVDPLEIEQLRSWLAKRH